MNEKYNKDKCFKFDNRGSFFKKIFEYDLHGNEGTCEEICNLENIYKFAETCLSINFVMSNTRDNINTFKEICFNILIKILEKSYTIFVNINKPDTQSLSSEILKYKQNIQKFLDEISDENDKFNSDPKLWDRWRSEKTKHPKNKQYSEFGLWKNFTKYPRFSILYRNLLTYINNDNEKSSLYYLFELVRTNKIVFDFLGQKELYDEITGINPRGNNYTTEQYNHYGLINNKFVSGYPCNNISDRSIHNKFFSRHPWNRSNCYLNNIQGTTDTELYKYYDREGIPTSCGLSGHILMFLVTYADYSTDRQFTVSNLKLYIMFCFSFLCLTGGHSLAECVSTLKIIYLYYMNTGVQGKRQYLNKFEILKKVVENIFVYDTKIKTSDNDMEKKYIKYERRDNQKKRITNYNPKQNMYNFFIDILPIEVSDLTEAMITDYILTNCGRSDQ